MDNILPAQVWLAVILISHGTCVLAVSIYYVPLVASLVVPWVLVSLLIVKIYQPAPLNIKRVESIKASELIAHISEMVAGATSIQVSPAAEKVFMENLYTRVDSLNRVRFKGIAAEAWIIVQSAFCSCIFFFSVGMLALQLRFRLQPSLISAVLITAFDLQDIARTLLESTTSIQRGLNSVERLHHYAYDIQSERATRSVHRPDHWPASGSIEFCDVDMRYRENLPLALNNLNIKIRSGEKIGVVGRTGAGKSTIYQLLLGFVDPVRGSIVIDGMDISKLGLHDLRESVAIIPQEPTLFHGTVRTNLDPLERYSDETLIQALAQVGLSSDAEQQASHSAAPLDLQSKITGGGANLSTGQRQLLSLARALVRKTKIVLIDEATASVDYQMDLKIQNILRGSLQDCTVVAIAHRISTIIGYDRVIVMGSGKVMEFDDPLTLWRRSDSEFRKLCDHSKITESDFGPDVSVPAEQKAD